MLSPGSTEAASGLTLEQRWANYSLRSSCHAVTTYGLFVARILQQIVPDSVELFRTINS